MKKNTIVSTKREQGNSKRIKNDTEAKARGFKVRTNIKAGDNKLGVNHNEAAPKSTTVSTKCEQGNSKRTRNDGETRARGLKVRTNIKAGAGADPGRDPNGRLAANHNETLAR